MPFGPNHSPRLSTAVEKAAPSGQFRVVTIHAYGPDQIKGDYPTFQAAADAALVMVDGQSVAHVYDDQGVHLFRHYDGATTVKDDAGMWKPYP